MAKPARKVRRVLVRVATIAVLAVFLPCAGGLVWEYTRPVPPPIPGNHRTTVESQPWIVAIQNPGGGGGQPGHKTCVGTLVAPRAVITAGHCVFGRSPAEFQVTGGRTDLRTREGITRDVVGMWIAPGYSTETQQESFLGGVLARRPQADADIGLLTLNEDMPYPALPIARGEEATLRGGAPADHFGWRISPLDEPVLWRETTSIVDDETCVQRAGDAVRLMPPVLHGYVYEPNSYLCAGIGDKALNIRATDSGSPLVVNGKLVGVTAWNPGKDPGLPDYFTRVAPHLDDINRHIQAAAS